MDGLRLAANGSFWIIHRTPDTFPTYLNDVAQSFVEFVATPTGERIRFRRERLRLQSSDRLGKWQRDPLYT